MYKNCFVVSKRTRYSQEHNCEYETRTFADKNVALKCFSDMIITSEAFGPNSNLFDKEKNQLTAFHKAKDYVKFYEFWKEIAKFQKSDISFDLSEKNIISE
jgi:hypothetical protein